jgi:hypothetical protein
MCLTVVSPTRNRPISGLFTWSNVDAYRIKIIFHLGNCHLLVEAIDRVVHPLVCCYVHFHIANLGALHHFKSLDEIGCHVSHLMASQRPLETQVIRQ